MSTPHRFDFPVSGQPTGGGEQERQASTPNTPTPPWLTQPIPTTQPVQRSFPEPPWPSQDTPRRSSPEPLEPPQGHQPPTQLPASVTLDVKKQLRTPTYHSPFLLPKLKRAIEAEEQKHFELRQTRRAIIGGFGPKGGVGKTTAITSMAYASAHASFQPTLASEARHKYGNLLERFGLERRDNALDLKAGTTVTLKQSLTLFQEGYFDTAATTQTILGSIPGCKLDVIVSNPEIDPPEVREQVPTLFAEMMRRLIEHYKLTLLECADEVGEAFDVQVMELNDLPYFVYRPSMLESGKELKIGLNFYAKSGFQQKIQEHGVLLDLDAERRETPESVSEMFEGAIPPERVVLVQHDNFFKTAGQTVSTIDYNFMPPKAYLQYLRALNLGLETLPRFTPEAIRPSGPTTTDQSGQ